MLLDTRHFGEINIDEDKVLYFEEGLIGFEDMKRYALIPNEDSENPFLWLQSIDTPDLAFAITDPFVFRKDYEIEISEKVKKQLEIEEKEDVVVYSIAVIPEDVNKISINLQGPLIINVKSKKGKQMILNTDQFPVRFFVFEDRIKNIE
ncbi:flagellar assembly factor FliW [Anaerosolibacter carboniphilus]|uniref:Flagellar assembly factor FliW n=1 Tax=Anaerosolibacter carboniphilus TaxID=1417629 RepID=A0A841L227_9FIRM|nr:flagellar assembly protein FliW [Anaerosolibacter carboniphilus]MBB6216415.1 flagellar assembly factor FliW [Anaerosolibacter carboniphilus]